MVDLRESLDRGAKKQRATHQDDATWARLQRGAELSGLTMSQMIAKLVWEDLHLPEDPVPVAPEPQPELPLEQSAPAAPRSTGIKGRPITEAELAQLEGRNIRDRERDFDLG